MRAWLVYLFLRFLRVICRTVFRYQKQWIGHAPKRGWKEPFRLVAILNHTSLYEFLYVGIVEAPFLWRMAEHGTIPIADVTLKRPLVGFFWRWVASNIVAVSRERDHTWEKVMGSIADPDAMVIILPEGRMKRANGLDKFGRPLVVRAGIADLISSIPEGSLLLAFSQGVHHIQVPGQTLPRLFQPVRMRFESIDIRAFREHVMKELEPDDVMSFRKKVSEELTRRRDLFCTSNRGGEDRPEEWPRGLEVLPPIPVDDDFETE